MVASPERNINAMTYLDLDYALVRQPDLISALTELIACPYVGTDPTVAEGMEVTRRVIETRLDAMGFRNRRRLDPADGIGQPVIYAELLEAPNAPTILVYAHYEVRSSDPLEKWDTPFEATERDGRLYGRGISEDKVPMLIALESLAAFIAVEGRMPVNVKLLIEGEEKTDSHSLPGILEAHRELLAADAVLSADGVRWRLDLVALNFGSRGNTGFELRLRTSARDLHSGRYGGIVANPLHVCAWLVAGLHDDSRRVVAPSFYDRVAEPTAGERAEIAEIPYGEAASFAAIGAAPHGEARYSTLARLWMHPTLDVNRMWGGYTGVGSKTVIPNEAFANLNMRPAPGKEPERAQCAVIDHPRTSLPPYATLDMNGERGHGGAYAMPSAHPQLLAAESTLKASTGETSPRKRIRGIAISDRDRLAGARARLGDVLPRHRGREFPCAERIPPGVLNHRGLAAWVANLREIVTIVLGDFAPFRRG